MNSAANLWKSSLGKKFVMAASGIILFLFVVGHLVGNLQIFGPPEMINRYGHFLKSVPELLWGVRLFLLACVTLHILTAVQLEVMNREARPVGYEGGAIYGAEWKSRYMLVSGSVIAAFVLYHLAHFTVLLPAVNGVGDFRKLETFLPGNVRTHDVYAMVVLGFQVWWVVLFYLIAQALLFIHLGHGVSSMFQSLGLRNPVWTARIKKFALVASTAIFIGYAAIPVSIYMHVIGADYADQKRAELKSAALVESVSPAAKEVK
jgi:succinate dehydrogenase / fumarate reductase, cytochrome b subunit